LTLQRLCKAPVAIQRLCKPPWHLATRATLILILLLPRWLSWYLLHRIDLYTTNTSLRPRWRLVDLRLEMIAAVRKAHQVDLLRLLRRRLLLLTGLRLVHLVLHLVLHLVHLVYLVLHLVLLLHPLLHLMFQLFAHLLLLV
jgi:hypothetical protein